MTHEKVISFFALFTSTGTLLCCALPAAIAAVAGGAAVSAFVSTFPWLAPLSQHKGWLFLVAGTLILVSGVFTLRPQGKLACAVTGGKGCEVAGSFQKTVFGFSLVLFVIGVLFAYLLVPILRFFES